MKGKIQGIRNEFEFVCPSKKHASWHAPFIWTLSKVSFACRILII